MNDVSDRPGGRRAGSEPRYCIHCRHRLPRPPHRRTDDPSPDISLCGECREPLPRLDTGATACICSSCGCGTPVGSTYCQMCGAATDLKPLERAVAIALEAHAGQLDKAGAPYILHPLRLMLQVEGHEARIAAVLHDVVEDSTWTLKALEEEGFSPAIIEAVDRLTRRRGENYFAFIRRAGRHPVSRAVKMADLRDNMDLSRIPLPDHADRKRIARYRRALEELEGPDLSTDAGTASMVDGEAPGEGQT